jgi:hypothetical protein
VIVASTPEQHKQALRGVLERLRGHGLVLNLKKCEFEKNSIRIPTSLISDHRARPLVQTFVLWSWSFPLSHRIAKSRNDIGIRRAKIYLSLPVAGPDYTSKGLLPYL